MTEEQVEILYGALVGVARASESNPSVNERTYDVLTGGLAEAYCVSMHLPASHTGSDEKTNTDDPGYWTIRAREERQRLVPKCSACANPCGRTEEYDLAAARESEPSELMECRKRLLIRLGKAAYSVKKAHHKLTAEQEGLFAWGLFEVGYAQSSEELEEVFEALENNRM